MWRSSTENDLVWSVALTPNLFTADAVVLDASRNIFVVGMANDFGDSYYDTYVAKYDPDGNLLGGNPLGERGGAASRDLAVSAEGTVFIAGVATSGGFIARTSPL